MAGGVFDQEARWALDEAAGWLASHKDSETWRTMLRLQRSLARLTAEREQGTETRV